jgi:hypothetical protein
MEFIKNISILISKFNFDSNFLSDIAAFEAVIVAIAIPLSFNIVSVISEKYQSEVISKRYTQEWSVRFLPIFLIFNIAIAITLRLFDKQSSVLITWKIFTLAAFILFIIITLILLIKFIPRLRGYMEGPKFILSELFDEAENLLRNKNLVLQQQKIVYALEGIGDILVFNTKRRTKNENIINGLERIREIIKKFISIQKEDPDKFKQRFLVQDYSNFNNKGNDEEINLKSILQQILDREKHLIPFSTAMNQILRIHETAIEVKNNEISIQAAYNLNWLLDDFSHTPNNELFVNQILEKLFDITKIAIKYQDNSMYTSSINWYIRIVFNANIQKEGSFNLAYLKLFDKNFFSSVKYIISENQTSLFKGLVSSLVDGLNISHGLITKIEKYIYYFISPDRKKFIELNKSEFIENKKKELEGSVSDLDNEDKLFEWLKRFNEIKEILHINFFQDFDQKQKKECKEKEEDIINSITTEFKYNNLLEIVFAIGAYCLFKQKYDFIKCLWEYKQPVDADASWVGHDIVPNNFDQVISLYFGKYLLERKFDFWEDHHGSEIYYQKYILLLLARVLQNEKINSEGKYGQFKEYTLPKLNIHRISDLNYSIDNLVETANKIREKKDVLSILSFDVENIKELFDDKLIPFLKILKEKAQKKIEEIHREQDISLKKIDEFKEDVLKGFNESLILRDIFKYYELYEDKTKENFKDKLEKIGINIVNDKAPFFNEWYIHYYDWGTGLGRDLAHGENSYILGKIISNCKEVNEKNIDKFLDKLNDFSNIIIFSINLDLYDFFKDSNNFIFSWHKNSQPLNVKGFEGWYTYKDKNIPVFSIYQNKFNKQILILNKTKLGKLMQYSPLDEGENENLKKDIFYINIQSFSENKELMDNFIGKPPEWLQKIGDKQKQREHLQEKASIQIFERFEYVKDSGFQGYLLNLEKSD